MKNRNPIFVALGAFVVLLMMAGCSPKAVADGEPSRSGAEAIVSVSWSMESDCAACHADQQGSLNDESCPAFMHQQQGLTCVQCHDDETGLAKAHEDAEQASATPTTLKLTSVDTETCFSCHGDYGELSALTAGEESALTDSQGTSVNPHEVPNLTEGHAKIDCSNCHSMHDASEPDVSEYCYSCHHQEVFECRTCHD